MLVLSTIAAYAVRPAPLSSMGHLFSFETPAGSWLIISALLGLLPTGIDVSLQASEWGQAKKVGSGKIRKHLEERGHINAFNPFESGKEALAFDTSKLSPHALEYCKRWFKIGLWDFRLGHVVSFLMACVFLLLAAVCLYPSSVEGTAVIGKIAKIFTLSAGPWMMIIFLIGSFAATYSTAFNYFDGWPRVVGACSRNLFRPTSQLRGIAREDLSCEHRNKWYSEFNIYRITMFYSLTAAVAMIVGLPRPVWLVLVASALALFIAPVVFCLESLLLLFGDTEGGQGVLSFRLCHLVQLGKPGRVHRPQRHTRHGADFQHRVLRSLTRSMIGQAQSPLAPLEGISTLPPGGRDRWVGSPWRVPTGLAHLPRTVDYSRTCVRSPLFLPQDRTGRLGVWELSFLHPPCFESQHRIL